ncbi:MAG: ECF-type sigma factor, partial [Planctomycetota bacterium]|nr:ECF-type sigma factor [Planctomycetota bacterium]
MLELHRALERLEVYDARQAEVVLLRYFGGLTIEQTAAALGVSPARGCAVTWPATQPRTFRDGNSAAHHP